jgi:glycosyltransferase involved in cell wall biosynthesis
MPEPFLSIVIPAYNETERIAGSLEAIQNYLRGKNFPVETILVDDGSTDNTVEVASGHAEVRVVCVPSRLFPGTTGIHMLFMRIPDEKAHWATNPSQAEICRISSR